MSADPTGLQPQAAGELAEIDDLAELVDLAAELVAEGISAETRRAYTRAWRDFASWCASRGAQPLPVLPEVIGAWIAHQVLIGAAMASIQQRLAAISVAHRAAGHPAPTEYPQVRAELRGTRRRIGVAPRRPREPAMIEDLRQMVAALPCTLAGTRDRALLLLGFAGAFRRGELVALELRDLRFGPEGATVTIRRSKVDQEAAGRVIGVPRARRPELCPVAALSAWIERAKLNAGPLFGAIDRHDHHRKGQALTAGAVAAVVKRAALAAGLDPARLAAHSLRRGFCTEAAAAGATEAAIMRQTGHKSPITLRGYIREGSVFLDNAGAKLL